MGRPLYIVAATFAFLALVCGILSFTNIAQQPGSAGDDALWRTSGFVLICIALVVALAAILSSLFEQAERRTEEQRRNSRNR